MCVCTFAGAEGSSPRNQDIDRVLGRTVVAPFRAPPVKQQRPPREFVSISLPDAEESAPSTGCDASGTVCAPQGTDPADAVFAPAGMECCAPVDMEAPTDPSTATAYNVDQNALVCIVCVPVCVCVCVFLARARVWTTLSCFVYHVTVVVSMTKLIFQLSECN